jgi:putative spermidine/putrescine transport system permease protein
VTAAASVAPRGASALHRLARPGGVALLVVPLVLVMLLGFAAPLLQGLVNSFHPNTPAGIDPSRWTLDNYARLFDSYYAGVFLRTLRVSLIISLITAVLAYPVAIYIAGLRPRAQALLLLIYVAPWLVNVVVKAFGWSLLLRGNGIVNQALRGLGLIDAPLQLMFNETGIVIGLGWRLRRAPCRHRARASTGRP